MITNTLRLMVVYILCLIFPYVIELRLNSKLTRFTNTCKPVSGSDKVMKSVLRLLRTATTKPI